MNREELRERQGKARQQNILIWRENYYELSQLRIKPWKILFYHHFYFKADWMKWNISDIKNTYSIKSQTRLQQTACERRGTL